MKKQRGAALVVVLSLLTMSLMLGLSGMQSSLVDERLAGNFKASAEARMAAESAASTAFFCLTSNDCDGVMPTAEKTIEAMDGQFFSVACNAWDDFSDFSNALSSLAVTGSHYCGSISSSGGVEGEYCYINLTSPVSGSFCRKNGGRHIVAMGSVRNSDSGLIAQSEAVLVSLSPILSFDDMPPMTFPSPALCESNNGICFPTSNTFNVIGKDLGDGEFGPAISYAGDAGDIEAMIPDNRIDNYIGGVSEGMPYPILDNASSFSSFISAVSAISDSGSGYGEPGEPKITYIDGDFSGGGGFYGSGIMVVNGDASFNGNPSFDGLLIILGDYQVSGSGNGNINGSLIVSPYGPNEEGVLEFTESVAEIEFSGGGNANYRHDSGALSSAFDLLYGDALDIWEEANQSMVDGGAVLRIGSWQ